MIFDDIHTGFNDTASGAAGYYAGRCDNANLMHRIASNLGVTVVPELRTDDLFFGAINSVTAVRFVRSKNYEGDDFGYIFLATVSGVDSVVIKNEKIGQLARKYFFKNESECFKLLDLLRKRDVLTLTARIQFDQVHKSAGLSMVGKVQAYFYLRSATTDKFKAQKMKNDIDVKLLTTTSVALSDASTQVNDWLSDATARHAAALAAYVALGGLPL